MKKTIFSLSVLLAVIFTFACNNNVTPAPATQKVILLYGNYSMLSNNTIIEFADGNNKLQLPVSSLLDGKALFGNAASNKFQGSLMFKNEGTTYAQINTFLKLAGARYSGNKLSPAGTQAIVPPIAPPPCGSGGACLGGLLFQVYTLEVPTSSVITTEATIQGFAQ
jgi:hypothetical protein